MVVVDHLDAQTLESIHKKPMYLAVCGQRRNEITLKNSYQKHYEHRCEPNNRFIKHQLGLDKLLIQLHFDIHLLVIELTEFLLLMASEEVSSKPKKW